MIPLSIAESIERLGIVNQKIWALEEKLMDNPAVSLQIRELNRERVALKNHINEFFKSGFKEVKVNHTSVSKPGTV